MSKKVENLIFKAESRVDLITPYFLDTVSAGFPSPATDYMENKLDLNEYLVQRPTATYIVKANGPSMTDAGILSGDLLIVDRSITPRNDNIVIASIFGDLTVKKLKKNMAKLFENDAYLREFKAKIIEIIKEDNRIELDQTAFYAKSGGQPGDKGEIETVSSKIQILDTIKENNKIINIVDDLKDLEENAEIIGKINWDLRYKHMRMHTALHLLCSIVPLGVTGGQIGYEKSRLDFNDPDKQINKEELEEKINLLVEDNHTITSEVIESSILEEKPELVRTMSVKPPQVDGKIRLIRIGDVDLQPCGGTHVKSTNEIGKIQIGKIENKGKMNRRVNLLLSS